MDWRQSRPMTGVRYLLETAQEEGLTPANCLIGSAITPEALHQQHAQIEAWQELAVIRNLIEHADRPGLGFRVGRRYHLTSLGLLGFTMLSSHTLSDAFATFYRFRLLGLTLCPASIAEDPQGIWLLLDASVLPQDARNFVIERGMAACLGNASELLQRPILPLAVEMSRTEAYPPELLSELFPYPVRCNASRNGILFSHDDLQRILPQAHFSAHSEGERLCEQLCAEISHSLVKAPTARLVQQVLVRNSATLLNGRTVAQQLGLAERTLYRRLAQEGHSFQQLNEQIKQRLAERLLSESRLNLNDIAHSLGYAEAASFARAFQRWHGCSPRHWQRQKTPHSGLL